MLVLVLLLLPVLPVVPGLGVGMTSKVEEDKASPPLTYKQEESVGSRVKLIKEGGWNTTV